MLLKTIKVVSGSFWLGLRLNFRYWKLPTATGMENFFSSFRCLVLFAEYKRLIRVLHAGLNWKLPDLNLRLQVKSGLRICGCRNR